MGRYYTKYVVVYMDCLHLEFHELHPTYVLSAILSMCTSVGLSLEHKRTQRCPTIMCAHLEGVEEEVQGGEAQRMQARCESWR